MGRKPVTKKIIKVMTYEDELIKQQTITRQLAALKEDKDIQEAIQRMYSKGMPLDKIALYCNMRVEVIKEFADSNPAFRAACDKEKNSRVELHLDRIARGDKSWQSSAWYLQNMLMPEFFAKNKAMVDPAVKEALLGLGEAIREKNKK